MLGRTRPSLAALRLAPWLLLSFLGGSVGALAFNILAARALKPASYSLLTSVVFIFALAGVVATGLSTANARSIARTRRGAFAPPRARAL